MKTKHTPGPWKVSRISQYTVMQGNGLRTVATTGGYSDNRRSEEVEIENRANAVLIAAAPDLLKCLQGMVGILTAKQREQQFPNIYNKAIEAI